MEKYYCKFCGRETTTKGGNTVHENRCYKNYNRIVNIPWNKNLELDDERRSKHSYCVKENPTSILGVSKRTMSKILKRLNIPCSNCGWNIKGIALDVHHILPKNKGGNNDMENLAYLCPNCHRLAHSGLLKSFKSMKDYVGDSWIKYYYNK